MDSRAQPNIYSIAAHRGFADALVAGLVPRYAEEELGLARLTLLVPSTRAARTISEAFIRHTGETGAAGLLMPRMVAVGDLDLDEKLGTLLDPLGASDIHPAVEPTRRWFALAQILREELEADGKPMPAGAAILRMARDVGRTMDRLLVEEKSPEDLFDDSVLNLAPSLAEHWQDSIRIFAKVQARWRFALDESNQVDAATRRNLLFDRAAREWRDAPPQMPPKTPIVAAGVTSAAPALARMLRSIANMQNGAVILPDLDLAMPKEAWDELGRAGQSDEPGGEVFGKDDALTHPQYHLKLLLGRMSIAREEVRQWHRKGLTAAEPARTHAISSLFLPPEASSSWADLHPDKRRLSGVRLLASATQEEEAQAIALLVREALEEPEKRIAVISADRNLARRVTQHLSRWNIAADDTAGRPLSLTPAGRFFALLAELASGAMTPTWIVSALAHPLVRAGEERREWLRNLRAFERHLRGPSPAPGFAPLRAVAAKAEIADWWSEVENLLAALVIEGDEVPLADAFDLLITIAEGLAGEGMWAREDGRALSSMIEDMRLHARATDTKIAVRDLANALREAMDEIAVRPPYGGHPRVSVYGLLESRMARADLVICAGLNEGSWPQSPGPDALLAPGVLRALGVPGAEFRIGLAAHDLAGAMGAPQVVLSRAERDKEGPTIPSRFLLRVEALLGDLADQYRENSIPAILPQLDRAAERAPQYPRPAPRPSADQRKVAIKVTALDRLLGDPYQFYAQEVLRLSALDQLEADPFSDPALRGTLTHKILELWHAARSNDPSADIEHVAEAHFRDAQCHPLFMGLWRPRLLAALKRFAEWIDADETRQVVAWERKGSMVVDDVRVYGRVDRIDRLDDGSLAIVDYKTGSPPSAAQVEAGFALQLGLLGLIARDGDFEGLSGTAGTFEYWSMAKKDGEFGFVDVPMKVGRKQKGLTPEEFLPRHEAKLAEAITRFINGSDPFVAKENPDYPGYTDYDQLMRLDEWLIAFADGEGEQ
ncbi:MAG: PD-(D/E)XK nuclease family protein [Pseudomonadota bacterium]